MDEHGQPVVSIMIRQARHEGQDMVYYDDFLGDGDVDEHGQPVVSIMTKQARHEGQDMVYVYFDNIIGDGDVNENCKTGDEANIMLIFWHILELIGSGKSKVMIM